MFQFLIGTLKLLILDVLLQMPDQVSIPYRHSKTTVENAGSSTDDPVFQFLIGTLKPL